MRASTGGESPTHREFPRAQDLSGELRKFIGRKVSYATHGIHRYPAKFIPQIPRFCMESYSKVGDVVLDPFVGSGTTLLEAYISGRDSLGIDIHPLARLIAKVKTTPLDPDSLRAASERVLLDIRADGADNASWVPEIPNREHWFRPGVLRELATIKKHVWQMRKGNQQDFLKICFSSIIRKVSNSDSDSLIPEVTTFKKKLDQQGKTRYDAINRFENTVRNRLLDAAELWRLSQEVSEKYRKPPSVKIIGRDARDIDSDDSSVDLAITSPPYASAVHYVSVHKLEMFWLDMIKSTAEIDGYVVGTARAYAEEYRGWEPRTRIPELNRALGELFEKDVKSAYIVSKYFEDMRRNFCEVNRTLRRNGKYCMVVGENTFRKVRIPTYRILAAVAEGAGFDLQSTYVYDVINRHLDIPRWNDSRIERDHILVFSRKQKPIYNSL